MCVLCNGSSVLFDPSIVMQVEGEVIQGSSEFLNSMAAAANMWSYAELAERDVAQLEDAEREARSATTDVRQARQRYRGILRILEDKGPNEKAVAALREFDYSRLAKISGFEGDQWERFVGEARCGNVHGLIFDFVEGLDGIERTLEETQVFLTAGKMPPATLFGSLMRQYQEIVNHGHQSAQVFRNLPMRQTIFERGSKGASAEC